MHRRTAIYIGSTGTSGELDRGLRQKVEAHGGCVVAVFADDDAKDRRKHRKSGWKSLLASLDGFDQIALTSAGDIPGKSVKDLLVVLGHLRDCGVGLLLLAENIDTSNGSALTVLEIIEVFRLAKLSQAIRNGQAKARADGKRIGRPEVPAKVRRQIEAALAIFGIRPTAKKFGVAPSTVINIRRSMAQIDAEAA